MFKGSMRIIGVLVVGILLLLGTSLTATVPADVAGKPDDRSTEDKTSDQSQPDLTDPGALKHGGTDYSISVPASLGEGIVITPNDGGEPIKVSKVNAPSA